MARSSADDKHKRYRLYFECVSKRRVPFACPRCGVELMPKNYERHCAETHDFDQKRACVWCWGRTSWSPRLKSENAGHLLECFREFIKPHKIAGRLKAASKMTRVTPASENDTFNAATVDNKMNITETTSENNTFNAATDDDEANITEITPGIYANVNVPHKLVPSDEPMCPARSFFDHDASYLRDRLPPEALESFALLEVGPPRVPYADRNVDLAASYLEKYAATRETHDWIHVMIKAVAFESFLRAVRDNEEDVRLLAFSCWCDGGKYSRARHRQHRHAVVVADKGVRFESDVWRKIGDGGDRPCAKYPCKGARRIVGPMHLVNTLGYLSKRMSRCEFSLGPVRNRDRPLKRNHFFIFETLPVGYRLPLVVSWDGGLESLMRQEIFRDVSVESVIRHSLDRKRSQWRQKMKDFYKLPRGLVLSVDRNFVPASQKITPHYVHLLNGRRLYFERASDRPDLWLARQTRGGNYFYDNVGEEWWTPGKSVQEKLNLVMPRVYSIKEMSLEIARLRETNEELSRRLNDVQKEEFERIKSSVFELENCFNKKFERIDGEFERLQTRILELVNKLDRFKSCNIVYNNTNNNNNNPTTNNINPVTNNYNK